MRPSRLDGPLANPASGQDGYTLFTSDHLVPYDGEPVTLKGLVTSGLEAAGEAGIAPEVEGRICTAVRPGPCLVVAE